MNSLIETLNQSGDQLLQLAWPMLWQSSLLIIVLFGFDFLLLRRVRASVRYALWLIVLVKLILPPTLTLPTSPAWWLHREPAAIQTPPPFKNYTVTYDQSPLPEVPLNTLPIFVPPAPVLTPSTWLLMISIFISSILLVWMLVRWWQITRQVQFAKTSERLAMLVMAAERQLRPADVGIKSSVPVKITVNTMSPAVCGLFRPAILIPQTLAENFSDEQLRAVLLHELIHLRRGDVWVNFLQSLLQIVYWWHPLVWLANARLRRVREEAVDDAVMLALADEADTYAPTLLEVAKLALNRPLASLGLVGILESRSALRQRIERLVDFRSPRRAGLTLVSLSGILAFTAVAVPMGNAPAPVENQAAPVSGIVAAAAPNTNPPQVLIESIVCHMSAADFQKTVSDLKFNPADQSGNSWWYVSPEKFNQLAEQFKISGREMIYRPRIKANSGELAQFYIGNDTNGFKFDCLSLVTNGLINLAVQSQVIETMANLSATNQFKGNIILENHSGFVFRINNATGSNVVAIVGIKILPAIVGTNLTGILTNPDFQKNLQALEQQTGVTNLAEPEAVKTSGRLVSGRGINGISIGEFVAMQDKMSNPDFQKALAELQKRNGIDTLPEPEVVTTSGHSINRMDPETLSAIQGRMTNTSVEKSDLKFYLTPEHEKILNKLNQIRIAELDFKEISLPEIVRRLNELAKQSDPEKTGVNFSIATNQIPTLAADTNIVLHGMHLYKIRLADVLDDIVLISFEHLKYIITDEGVLFSLKDENPQFFMRAFKVDTNAFISKLKHQSNMPVDNTTNVSSAAKALFTRDGINLMSPPGKSVFYNDRLGVLFVRATESDLDVIERAIQTLNQVAPQVHIKARFIEMPKTVWNNYKKSFGIDYLTNQTVAIAGKHLTNQSATVTGIMTEQNFRKALSTLQLWEGVETLAEPEVVTTSGRQTQMRVTQIITVMTNFTFQETVTNVATDFVSARFVTNSAITPQTAQVETGPILDTIPYVLADGYTVNLTAIPSTTDFLGYNNSTNTKAAFTSSGERVDLPIISPAFQIRQAIATANLWDGQTLVMETSIPAQVQELDAKHPIVPTVGHLFQNQSKAEPEKTLLVFTTVNIVDPAGNRVHSDADLPFAQNTVPVQPKK